MAYTAHTWIDGDTTKPVSAVRVGAMDDAIAAAHTTADSNTTAISGLNTRLTTAESDIDAVETRAADLESVARNRYVSGRYYNTIHNVGNANAAPTQSRIRAYSWYVDEAVTIDRIACIVTTGVASATLRWGIWADNGADGLGTLLLDTGAVGDASTGGFKEATINLALPVARHWIGTVAQGANPTLTMTSGSNFPGVSWTNTADIVANPIGGVRTVDGVTGALASDPTAAATTTNAAPIVFIRVA